MSDPCQRALPRNHPAVARIIGLLVIAGILPGAIVVQRQYVQDMVSARARATTGSRVAQTPCGPIEYAVAGAGIPLLVVHGAGGGFDQGMYLAGSLAAQGFRVVAMSRFGYLRTLLPVDASVRAQAAAHACLLDALHIRRAAIVGASAGAPSSMEFALQYPERTAALILLVPATYVPRPGHAASLRTPPGLSFLFDTALRSDFLFWAASRMGSQMLARAILATPPEVIATANQEEQQRVAQIMKNILPVSSRRRGLLNDAAITSALPRYDLERIAAPTLIISTADDLFGTFDAARYTAGHIPGARFIGYGSGGHLLVGHQRDVLARISAFLGADASREFVDPSTPHQER